MLRCLNNPKKEAQVFAVCWFAYFSVYLGRVNYSAAMVQMVSDGFITKTEGGQIAASFFFLYGFGQFFMGFIGDRVSPFKMVAVGMSVSALCNIAMTFQHSGTAVMCVIWGVNGVAQSAVWSPIIRVLAQTLSPQRHLKASVNIITSGVAGTLAAYLMSTALLRFFGWKSVFFSGGAVVAAGMATMLIYYLLNNRFFTAEKAEAAGQAREHHGEEPGRSSSGNAKTVFLIAMVLAVPVILHGMLKDSITAWFPVYLNESHDSAPYMAVMLTTLLPAVNLSGVYASKWIYGKTRSNEFMTCAVLFALCAAAVGLMLCFGQYSMYIAVVLAAIGTSSIAGINCILISVLPVVRFGSLGVASTITGVLNSLTYLGCAISMTAFGTVVDSYGWLVTIATWCALASFGVLLCLIMGVINGKSAIMS